MKKNCAVSPSVFKLSPSVVFVWVCVQYCIDYSDRCLWGRNTLHWNRWKGAHFIVLLPLSSPLQLLVALLLSTETLDLSCLTYWWISLNFNTNFMLLPNNRGVRKNALCKIQSSGYLIFFFFFWEVAVHLLGRNRYVMKLINKFWSCRRQLIWVVVFLSELLSAVSL